MIKKSNIIKDLNLNKLRKALKEVDKATKPQLAQLTGLSVVTINSLVNTLITIGEIVEAEVVSSEGGRPALSYHYNSEYRLALAIYMLEEQGVDKAFYRVINLRGEVINSSEQRLVDVQINSFDRCIEESLIRYPNIQAICFGVPGEEIEHRLIIIDYEGLRNQSLSEYISRKFQKKVCVENDINAAVMGYAHRSGTTGGECIVGLYFPGKYPPGGGIYFNNQIYKGRNGLAGEIKYLPFGIDWDTFNYDPLVYEDVIIRIIQAFQCMYNPDEIVLYGEMVNQRINQLVQERCASMVEKLLLAKLHKSEQLNRDFEVGICQIALEMINTEKDLERI